MYLNLNSRILCVGYHSISNFAARFRCTANIIEFYIERAQVERIETLTIDISNNSTMHFMLLNALDHS